MSQLNQSTYSSYTICFVFCVVEYKFAHFCTKHRNFLIGRRIDTFLRYGCKWWSMNGECVDVFYCRSALLLVIYLLNDYASTDSIATRIPFVRSLRAKCPSFMIFFCCSAWSVYKQFERIIYRMPIEIYALNSENESNIVSLKHTNQFWFDLCSKE